MAQKAVFKLDSAGYPKFYMDFMPGDEAEAFAAQYGDGFLALTYGEYIARQDPDDESEARQHRRIHGKAAASRNVVISGTVTGHTRESAAEAMRARGYTVTSEVTGKTAMLITGDKPGPSKVAKAAKLGIPVVAWENVEGEAA